MTNWPPYHLQVQIIYKRTSIVRGMMDHVSVSSYGELDYTLSRGESYGDILWKKKKKYRKPPEMVQNIYIYNKSLEWNYNKLLHTSYSSSLMNYSSYICTRTLLYRVPRGKLQNVLPRKFVSIPVFQRRYTFLLTAYLVLSAGSLFLLKQLP